MPLALTLDDFDRHILKLVQVDATISTQDQIGRASCRERV